MTELTKEILQELAKPFPASKISIKVQTKPNDNGNALCVAYIDARDVMERLDTVVGGEWSDDYRSAPSGGLECALTVCGVTRRDVGDDQNDNEQQKAGYSDAFKRAAVKFGIGRFLYDLPKMFGKVKQVGKNFYLDDGEEARLRNILTKAMSGEKVSEPESKPTTEPIRNKTKREKLVERYTDRLVRAATLGIDTNAWELTEKMTDDEIGKLGVALNAEIVKKEQEGK